MNVDDPFDVYFTRATRAYCSFPAETGSSDKALLALAQKIDLSRKKIVVDYGCGQGRLLAAINKIHGKGELSNLHYIGVDVYEDAIEAAKTFFESTLAKTGVKAMFRYEDNFDTTAFLADQIFLIFTVHEFDPINLDATLSRLWRMLRRGGTLYIQDTGAPIYKEVEFLSFEPQRIEELLQSFGANVSSETIKTGVNHVPVYIVAGHKPADLDLEIAYSWHDLKETYRQVLHRSLLRDCFELYRMRTAIDNNKTVDSEKLAAACHRIAVFARGFHQTYALDRVDMNEAPYCVACGSGNVISKTIEPNVKDSGEIKIKCSDCDYEHRKEIEVGLEREDWEVRDRFSLLDAGKDRFTDWDEHQLTRCLLSFGHESLSFFEPFLLSVPGANRSIIKSYKRFIR